ncbi:subtilase family protein [Mariprofundus micogutta]|uniref:Subtilase family protein n=1 Tax=Mariprofundus micogutta TaxID=1921010 RepID=A0A1L8CRB9_9PROT|nr:S8 family peptidase [Mariprofundus micogutta]GAV21458.1 subtilase family protein [Mariprofundus micogutta]
MTARYLIGRGELLTYKIDAPKKNPGEKKHPYSLDEAKAIITPQIIEANRLFSELPDNACVNDMVVAKVVLHPSYIAKSYFPKSLFEQAGLTSVGSRTLRVSPRKVVQKKSPKEMDTTELFVAGTRYSLSKLPNIAEQLTEGEASAKQFTQIESFSPMLAFDRIKDGEYKDDETQVFEVGLHMLPEGDSSELRAYFSMYALFCGFQVNSEFEFEAGRLLFLAIEGNPNQLEKLAQFTLMRVIRPMARIRAISTTRSMPVVIPVDLPSAEPLSNKTKAAILDGGLPSNHVLSPYIRRYFLSDENADDVTDYLDHGLGVTSAVLFGAINPMEGVNRPYSYVDHHRVLDSKSDEEDPYELFRTLGHIETVLLSRQYQFINLSLGPDLAIEDTDVHVWTSVLDSLLSNGETLLAVAIGNNGQRDELTQLNRIQVPADCVNALSVGASDVSGSGWQRASYSAKGPGRSPGRHKPDVVAFGGSPTEYFHVISPGVRASLSATLGTSYSAPLALRSAIGISAILGDEVHPLSIKALLIHGCESHQIADMEDVGRGRVPSDIDRLITCGEGEARIIYQGALLPGKYLRAPIPLPDVALMGKVRVRATFCYASPVDPHDTANYTKAGLEITFRPHCDKFVSDKAANAKSQTFFPLSKYRSEAELRSDLGKWETVLHDEKSFLASSLKKPVFDVHYNARDGGGPVPSGAPQIRYALVLTLIAPKHVNLHQEILRSHAALQMLEPQVSLPLRT